MVGLGPADGCAMRVDDAARIADSDSLLLADDDLFHGGGDDVGGDVASLIRFGCDVCHGIGATVVAAVAVGVVAVAGGGFVVGAVGG